MTDHKQVTRRNLFWIKIWIVIGALAWLGLFALLRGTP